MSLIEYTFGGKVDKVKKSIERIRAFEPIQNGWFDEPYYVCYSGGKDSDAIRILFELSGVPFELWHSHTTADAPETVRYVRSIQDIHIRYPTKSMWQLIAEKMMPPSRTMRYCCGVLKESGGEGRFVVTGVRWQESKARKRRGGVEVQARKQENALILNEDNDESRRMIESCQMKGKRVLNPIIDWSETDVWELLRHYGCKGNPLYAEGKKTGRMCWMPDGRGTRSNVGFSKVAKIPRNVYPCIRPNGCKPEKTAGGSYQMGKRRGCYAMVVTGKDRKTAGRTDADRNLRLDGRQMMSIRFVIPYPKTGKARSAWAKTYGLNAYWAGKHWAKRKADAEYWHTLVRTELRRQGVKRMVDGPFAVRIYWNDRLDLDNHAAMGKMIVDALKGVIIPDDSRRWFKWLEYGWHDEDWIEVEIEEWRDKR